MSRRPLALVVLALAGSVAPPARGGDGTAAAGHQEFFEVRRGGVEPSGWARLGRGQDPTGAAWFELELRLAPEDVVLHQFERVDASELLVVHRERRPGAGRTLRARWIGPIENARSERVEWAGRERLAAHGEGPRPATPLALGDAARAGAPGHASIACYVAAADAEEPWAMGARAVSLLPGALGARLCTWRDARGDVRAWRLVAAGRTLAFGFAPGSPVAVRCSPARFDALRSAVGARVPTE